MRAQESSCKQSMTVCKYIVAGMRLDWLTDWLEGTMQNRCRRNSNYQFLRKISRAGRSRSQETVWKKRLDWWNRILYKKPAKSELIIERMPQGRWYIDGPKRVQCAGDILTTATTIHPHEYILLYIQLCGVIHAKSTLKWYQKWSNERYQFVFVFALEIGTRWPAMVRMRRAVLRRRGGAVALVLTI